jgi:hypothetical protein
MPVAHTGPYYTVSTRGSGFRPALLPEEEQEGDRHSEVRYGHHSRSAESGRRIGTGATKCKNGSLKASRVQRSSGNVFADLELPRRRKAQDQDRLGGRNQEGQYASLG